MLKTATKAEAQPDPEVLSETVTPSAVAVMSPESMPLGGMDGELDAVAMSLPFLQVSHAQGKLENFRKGSLVIGNDSLIANPGDPVRITIVSARVYWKEYLSGAGFDASVKPRTFKTRKEAEDAGLPTRWVNNVPPKAKMAVAMKALIEQPAGIVCGFFGVEIGGKKYAPVLWSCDKTAAQRVAPVIKSDLSFSLRTRGLYSGIYEMQTVSVKFATTNHSTYVPTLKLVGYHTDEEVKQIVALCKPDSGEPIDVDEA